MKSVLIWEFDTPLTGITHYCFAPTAVHQGNSVTFYTTTTKLAWSFCVAGRFVRGHW